MVDSRGRIEGPRGPLDEPLGRPCACLLAALALLRGDAKAGRVRDEARPT